MQYREFQPHAVLADSVLCFWILEQEYPPGGSQDVTPDGCVELIFNFGAPYVPRDRPPDQPFPAACVVGFQKRTIHFAVSGVVKVVAARLHPWAAMTMLGADARETADVVKGLVPAWDRQVEALREFVLAGQYAAAVATLQSSLIERAIAHQFERRVVRTAAQMLQRTKGNYRIEEVAEECRMSVRQLERGFQRDIGTTPKVFARTVRFEAARRRLMLDPETDLTRVAYEAGYADQSHFIHEFRTFSGRTPGEYAREMQCLQSRLGAADVVFLQSQTGRLADKEPGRSPRAGRTPLP